MTESFVWKVVLAYDGTEFHGWQVQPGRATVQGELRDALARITGEEVLPQGSGRTDAGVHALGQVASFALAAPIPEGNLLRALNRTLPAAIRVLSTARATSDFHARHSAVGKTYEYRIFRGEICHPWLARYVYAFNAPLDVSAMQRAAARVSGEHDFTSFAATDPDRAERDSNSPPGSPVEIGDAASCMRFSLEKTANAALTSVATRKSGFGGHTRCLHTSQWIQKSELLLYRVSGNGFLHHMVRNLVGTFLEVGRGNLDEAEIPQILTSRSRQSAGPTAPARGLFLVRVEYGAN